MLYWLCTGNGVYAVAERYKDPVPRKWCLCRFCKDHLEDAIHAMFVCKHVLVVAIRTVFFQKLFAEHPELWGLYNRELAQKPHKPHAAFWHCTKPHAEIRSEVTEKPSQWRGSWVHRQVLASEKLHYCCNCSVQDEKSV
jgi:hypothetical protein